MRPRLACLPLIAVVAACSPTPSPAPSFVTRPVATQSAAPTATPPPSPPGLVLGPGAPIDDATFAGLTATDSGFLASGWTADFGAPALAAGTLDGRAWQPLDAGRVFGGPLDGITVGPRGWVATQQVQNEFGGTGAAVYFSEDGSGWRRLPDQASLGTSLPSSLAAGPWGFALLGEPASSGGSSLAAWVSNDGRSWRLMPGLEDAPQQLAVTEHGVLVLGYETASFSADGIHWLPAETAPGIADANSSGPLAVLGGDVLLLLGTGGAPRVLRGHVDAGRAGSPVVWSDAALSIDNGTSATGLAAGPLGAVVLGFDRATLDPIAWTSRDGVSWQHVDLDRATFGGGVPSVVAAGEEAFVALGWSVNQAGAVRARAWTSTDGLSWSPSESEALGVLPAPPSEPCPATAPTNATTLIKMAEAYPVTPGAVWPLCFGDRELRLKGYIADCGGCGGAGVYVGRPAWLLEPLGYARFWLNASSDEVREPFAIPVQFPSGHHFTVPRAGTAVRITGHFDDAASQRCRLIPAIGANVELPPAGESVATCQRQFVLTSIKVLSG